MQHPGSSSTLVSRRLLSINRQAGIADPDQGASRPAGEKQEDWEEEGARALTPDQEDTRSPGTPAALRRETLGGLTGG